MQQKKMDMVYLHLYWWKHCNNYGMSIEEIKFAVAIGKPVVAVKITDSTSSEISALKIPIVSKRKDSLEIWIRQNV